MQKNKKIIYVISIIFVVLLIIFIIISNKVAKKSKIGKNSSSQEIVNYILDISSYESKIEVEVKSNKNSNKYKIKQTYIENEKSIQEILEPNNIKGTKIIKEKNQLKIENTNLSLTKILQNYNEITKNSLDLDSFIKDYKANPNSQYKEQDKQIVMETTAQTENKYQKYETLYISKETGKPEKMQIKDTNQNVIIYIIYNEININELKKDKIYAFEIKDISKEI